MYKADFSERLKELITDSGKNVIEIAKDIDVNKTTIYSYLLQRKIATLQIAIRLADYFCCSLDFLFGRTEIDELKNKRTPPLFKERLPFILNFFNSNEYKLSKATKISRSITYAWLTGKSSPSFANLIKIANYYNCSLDFLIGRQS